MQLSRPRLRPHPHHQDDQEQRLPHHHHLQPHPVRVEVRLPLHLLHLPAEVLLHHLHHPLDHPLRLVEEATAEQPYSPRSKEEVLEVSVKSTRLNRKCHLLPEQLEELLSVLLLALLEPLQCLTNLLILPPVLQLHWPSGKVIWEIVIRKRVATTSGISGRTGVSVRLVRYHGLDLFCSYVSARACSYTSALDTWRSIALRPTCPIIR